MSLSEQASGLLACAGAVALFALFSLPTKTHELGDGIAFQLLMCLGIWAVGCCVLLAQCAGSSGCPPLSPLAALGGAIWCLSNCLLTSIVKCIGVGPAMLQWGLIECLIGWSTAKWGLFGVAAQPVRDAAANDGGVALVVLSLAILALVQPAVADGSDKDGTAAAAAATIPAAAECGGGGGADAAHLLLGVFHGLAAEVLEPPLFGAHLRPLQLCPRPLLFLHRPSQRQSSAEHGRAKQSHNSRSQGFTSKSPAMRGWYQG